MKKILITGCAGFIGFHLCKRLFAENEVFGIDDLNDYYDKNLKQNRLDQLVDKISFSEIDITNLEKLKKFFDNNNFDIIIHLAAQAGVRYSFSNPDSYIQSNIIGTFNILELVKNTPQTKIIFSSTSSVYGLSSDKKPFRETNDTNKPISLYSATKKSCEVMLHNYSQNFNLQTIILRFFTVYGPWGRPDMALFKFVKSIINNEPITVFNDGNMWRDFTYIDDLVESISRVMNISLEQSSRVENDSLSYSAPYRIINIGNQNSIKLSDFIETIEKVMKKNLKKLSYLCNKVMLNLLYLIAVCYINLLAINQKLILNMV